MWPTDEQFDKGFEKLFQKIQDGEIAGFTLREDEEFLPWLERVTAGSDYTQIQMMTDNAELAELWVQKLGRVLHVCSVDVAAMSDITAIALKAIYNKHRGGLA